MIEEHDSIKFKVLQQICKNDISWSNIFTIITGLEAMKTVNLARYPGGPVIQLVLSGQTGNQSHRNWRTSVFYISLL